MSSSSLNRDHDLNLTMVVQYYFIWKILNEIY